MPQDAESGKRANIYGHKTSQLIAEKIGAISVSDNSNEFALGGHLITIRCAKEGNLQVGVLYSMLDRVDSVIAAFEEKTGVYQLYEMSPFLYKIYMRDSKNEGIIGLVAKKTFMEVARALDTVIL